MSVAAPGSSKEGCHGKCLGAVSAVLNGSVTVAALVVWPRHIEDCESTSALLREGNGRAAIAEYELHYVPSRDA